MADNFLYTIGRSVIPKKFRPDLRNHLLKAGYSDVPYSLFGVIFFIGSAITYFLYIFFFFNSLKANNGTLLFGLLTFVTFAVTMFLILFSLSVIVYFYWNIKIYNRTKELELLLPVITRLLTRPTSFARMPNSGLIALHSAFSKLMPPLRFVDTRVR